MAESMFLPTMGPTGLSLNMTLVQLPAFKYKVLEVQEHGEEQADETIWIQHLEVSEARC